MLGKWPFPSKFVGIACPGAILWHQGGVAHAICSPQRTRGVVELTRVRFLYRLWVSSFRMRSGDCLQPRDLAAHGMKCTRLAAGMQWHTATLLQLRRGSSLAASGVHC
jgi:hypothetical protein